MNEPAEPSPESSSPMPQPLPATVPEHAPLPLNYHKPVKRRIPLALSIILGVLVGVISVGYIGVTIGFSEFGANQRTDRGHIVLLWSAVLVIATIGTILLICSSRKRWFLLGLLISIGVMALLEGICFSG